MQPQLIITRQYGPSPTEGGELLTFGDGEGGSLGHGGEGGEYVPRLVVALAGV